MRENIDGFDALLAIRQNFTPQNFPPTIRTVETRSSCNTCGGRRDNKGAVYNYIIYGGRVSGVIQYYDVHFLYKYLYRENSISRRGCSSAVPCEITFLKYISLRVPRKIARGIY